MSRKIFSYSAVIASLLATALFAGCGTSNKEGNLSAANVAKVDEATCRTCHATSVEPLTGASILEQFFNSPHVANGCQSCHGGGAMHNGVGPIAFPKPGPEQCGQCHTAQDSAEYATSKHATVATEDGEALCNRCHTHEGAVLGMKNGYTGDKAGLLALAAVQPAAIQNASVIQCATCHVMHEGKLRTDATWKPALQVGYSTAGGSDQYSLCTGCHTYINEAGVLVASGNNGTAKFQHETAWNRVIASTHFDNPATGVQAVALPSTKIEGYVIRTNGANPCFDCHGHESKTETNILGRNADRQYVRITPESTTYTDWAKSGHAGGLLTNKYAAVDAYPKKADGTYDRSAGMLDAVMAAGVDGTSGPAWEHYDWDSASRQSCQRCHTSTGASNFMTAPATYSAANNNFTHLSGWNTTTKTSPQNELLYCWGCHSNAGTGALRTPGAIVETYGAGAVGDPVTKVTYPDVAGSNVCMTCHLGRETGEVIKNNVDADGVRGFINSHYLAAGGTLFGTTGYEYTGLNYENPSFFKHDKIGTAAAAGTGTNGPCVGCHMTTPNKHQFKNVTKDDTGAITAITSTACATCHAGDFALTAQKLTDEEEEYKAAIDAAAATLASKGIYFSTAANPYFFTAPYVAGGTNVSYTNWAGPYGVALWKETMGAAFNTNLLAHDPGGYAHNRYYAKRLIWDSIDFISNGIIDNDVVAAIDAQVTAGTLSAEAATAAKTYLGTARP